MKNRFLACVITLILMFNLCNCCVYAAPIKSLNASWIYDDGTDNISNIRKIAKQSATGYNVLQGCCSDDANNFYFSFMNKSNEKIKVVKMQYINGQFVFVSSTGVLNCYHGNDMTYIPNVGGINGNDKILITNGQNGYTNYIKVLDVATMQQENDIYIKWWKKTNLKNCELIYADGTEIEEQETLQDVVEKHGFSNIAYDKENNRIISCLCTIHDFLVFDLGYENGSLKLMPPSKYIIQSRTESTSQGIDCDSDYIYMLWSPKSGVSSYNRLCVYDWDGANIKNYKVDKTYEAESISHIGTTTNENFFSTYHYSYIYKYTTKEKKKVKWKKVWNKAHTKKVWKYKTKTVNVEHKETRRNAYIKNLGYINSAN